MAQRQFPDRWRVHFVLARASARTRRVRYTSYAERLFRRSNVLDVGGDSRDPAGLKRQ